MRGIDVSTGSFVPHGRFGRMFPNLDPAPDDKKLAEVLGDPLGPMAGTSGFNHAIPAGFTYLGQFIDHDLTFDPTSSLEKLNDPRAIQNFRTPAFELDSVYGAGPDGSPYFYTEDNPICFRFDNAHHTDLPRLNSGMAVIADARNDSNFFVSQLHTAFLNFHNYVITRKARTFEEAQRLVRWHYQWIVLKEYLPKIVEQRIIDDCLREGLRFFRWNGPHPFIPVEFSLAAFRFGHSQIRPQYVIGDGKGFIGTKKLFGPNVFAQRRPMDWKNIMPMPGSQPTPSGRIGLLLVEPLMDLPDALIRRRPDRSGLRSDPEGTHAIPSQLLRHREKEVPAESETIRSLAYRDIRRGQVFGLPSGTDVALRMGLPEEQVLAPRDVWALINPTLRQKKKDTIDPDTPVPLWIYVLAEAQSDRRKNSAFGDGARLGPVGGRIVAEVIVGLLYADSKSFVSQQPNWKPQLPREDPEHFKIADLLLLAEKGQSVR